MLSSLGTHTQSESVGRAATHIGDPQNREFALLPTRVSNACQRCRRNKSRCDSFRPCSLCRRANVACLPPTSNTSGRPQKKPGPRRSLAGRSALLPPQQSPIRDYQNASFVENSASEHHSESSASATPNQIEDRSGLETQSVDVSPSVDYGEAESAMGITRKIFLLSKKHITTQTTSAIPDGNICVDTPSRQQHRRRHPIASVLGCTLPPMAVMETLLEEYFVSVHWFSLIIYEPKFRAQFNTIADGFAHESQRGFLLLLSTVLGVAAWYRSQRSSVDSEHPGEDWTAWKSKLLKHTESHMFELMDQASLASVQTYTLLGSYNVYHGRPNSSFALLGATIKAAQALGLHREPSRGGFDDHEERKRIWWTIYTWDRFASITYGRPLGINDKDCNVTMPSDIYESPHFRDSNDGHADSGICFSVYQRQLNMLYSIASPMIEAIFGIRTSKAAHQLTGDAPSTLVRNTSERLSEWRRNLPPDLALDFDCDVALDAPAKLKAHRLQALALQLTFDNITIILHRPFLAQQVDSLSKPSLVQIQEHVLRSSHLDHPTTFEGSPASHSTSFPSSPEMRCTGQWWSAAVRTSRITELPQLAQLATDSHLVAFLAINLFNSAIVMVVCALTDPLSDKAQEAKRYITRIYRLLELLGRRSTLPKQSSIVLRDVIRMLLQHEEEAMLATVTSQNASRGDNSDRPSNEWRDVQISVQDTLRLPLHASVELADQSIEDNYSYGLNCNRNEAIRLNESLISVQKVFPTFRWDDSQPLLEQKDEYSQPFTDTSDIMDGIQIPSASTNEQGRLEGFTSIENGLFWIWDSVDPTAAWS